ncbi:MAG: substrate-binding periplasmic protein [Noviherbaspirillum sp.]
MKWFLCMLFCLTAVSLAASPLTVVTEELPPYSHVENGEVVGMSTEVVKATLKRAGLPYRIEIYPWARALSVAQSTDNVLIYSILRTPERDRMFKWVGTIAPRKAYFFKLRARRDVVVHTLEDAKWYAIGGVKDDARVQYLQSKGIEVKVLSTKEDLNIRQLEYGRIDLMIANEYTFNYRVKALGLAPHLFEKAFFLEEFSKNEFSMAFSLGTDDSLVAKTRAALERLKASGEYKRIIEKYTK